MVWTRIEMVWYGLGIGWDWRRCYGMVKYGMGWYHMDLKGIAWDGIEWLMIVWSSRDSITD